ncbi:uncharacterized protein [Montipora capricornis]|uniref:uncharacterized protein n=1 Tax=Montipora capricornis TaxID=246305 RepID=UPI0035F12FE1
MEVDGQGVSLTGEHSLESAAEVMSVLQFDQRLPNGREDYMKVLRDLGFESNEDGSEQHTQFVFQGQCLILGDANVGKTSLTKSLMGKPFDTKEPGTKDVEISFVDREWNDLDGYNGVTFGNFHRFATSVLARAACYGPGGLEVEFAVNRTKICRIITTSKLFLQLSWVILVILCFAFNPASVPVWFFLFSFAAFLGAHLSEQLDFNIEYRPVYFNLYKILMLIYTTPYFITGLGTVHILTKNCKGLFDCLKAELIPNLNTELGCWDYHFFIFTVLVAKISVNLSLWTLGYFRLWPIFKNRDTEESQPLLPGQKIIAVNSSPTLLHIIPCSLPVLGGFICAYVVAMSTERSILEQNPLAFCTQIVFILQMIHVVISCAHDFQVGGKIKRGVYLVSIIILLFCHENLKCGAFLLLWFYNLFKDREIFCPGLNELMSGVTFIYIERVLMNFTKLKSALDKAFSSLKLKLVDFPGDDEYCAHHIFMRHEAMYVVVFNMANFVNGNFRNMTGKIKRIRFWLESICNKASPKSHIILVGTHRGHVDQYCSKIIDTHLRKYLWHDFGDELVLNKEEQLVYFGIENSLGRDDNGIKNLQREIMLATEKQKATMGKEIPYSWIKIQDAIINLRKNKKAKFCVTKHMFPVSVGNFICSNWSQDTLRYFNAKGLIIYVGQKENPKLSDWILLKPELLVDIVKALVTPLTTQQDGLRRDRTLLHEKGMLTNRLLEKTISRFNEDGMALKSFLEEYDMICPLFYSYKSRSEEEQVTHFVPSLLPISSHKDPQVWVDGPDDKKFYVFFHRFLPEPLFHKLLSRAHMLSKVQFPKGHPLVCSNVGRFWLQPNQPYMLLLLKNEEMIEVTCNSSEGMEPKDVLCHVFHMVDGICWSSFPFAKFHCGPACPSTKCPGYQGDYLTHPGVQSSRSKRRHVFNILPARKKETTCIDSFYCVNKNFWEQMKEWEL